MKKKTMHCSRLLFFGTILLLSQITWAREIGKSNNEMTATKNSNHRSLSVSLSPTSPPPPASNFDPQLNVFFTPKDLKIGKKLQLFFDVKDESKYNPHLLSREEANSIPFSSSHLPYLLSFFSFSSSSPQAKAMAETLGHCEVPPGEGETKFCATSLESLLNSTRHTFGPRAGFRVISTRFAGPGPRVPLQNYTIVEAPAEVPAEVMLGCHALPYPYAVFYCHSGRGRNKVYEVSLVGDDDVRVHAVGVCHLDTATWDKSHVSFCVLGIEPGSSPVCHFFPVGNLVWVPSL